MRKDQLLKRRTHIGQGISLFSLASLRRQAMSISLSNWPLLHMHNSVSPSSRQLRLGHDYAKVAGECVTKTLTIASRYGMKRQKISALMLLGEVTLERGNRDSARQIFITAQRLAEHVGYHLKGETAHQILLRNGLHPKRQLQEL